METKMTVRKLISATASVMMLALATPASAELRSSAAYKESFDFLGDIQLDHTYFCLNPDNDGTDCYSIIGFGVSSSKSGGDRILGTRRDKDVHQRCLARARASNSLSSACGMTGQLFGINGVCHQHTNRALLSIHGSYINPGAILGGWWSFVAYGPYGKAAAACFVESEAKCAFTW